MEALGAVLSNSIKHLGLLHSRVHIPTKSVRKTTRRNRGSRRNRTASLIKTAVLPMAVNYTFPDSSSHDIHPETASSSDVIFRASSCDVFVACVTPQTFQAVLYNEGRQVMATEPVIVSLTTKRFRLRAPRYLDYTTADATYWRFILTGPGKIAGTATFTSHETLSGS